MKKTLVSLAAASLIVTSAMAADKGVDIVTTGQAVVYYETHADNGAGDAGMFNSANSAANVGVQLNLDADLGNNFTFGSQLSYLGTAGLEKNLVDFTRQDVTDNSMGNISDEIALTKIFIAKKVANTTVKIGRQELPKSLSPFAFSEGWNVLKNTFEAILAVNTDIPNTTIVGAYVGQGNSSLGGNFSTFGDLHVPGTTGTVGGTAYMLTVQNKSIPMTTLTASYYDLQKLNVGLPDSEGASALWIDAAISGKDLPMGMKIGLQGGTISPSTLDSTSAFGAKVAVDMDALNLELAYSSVNDGAAAMKNTGTDVKTPLYTQMLYNQDSIAKDADTYVLSAAYNLGDAGKIVAKYDMTSAGKSNLQGSEIDYSEFDLMYKVKTGGVQYFAAWIYRSYDENQYGKVLGNLGTDSDSDNRIRVWARYNF